MYDCHVATFQEYPFTKSLNMKQSKIWPQSKVDMDERCFALGHRLRLMYKSKTRLESWAMDQCYNNLSCFGWLLVFFLLLFSFFPFKFQPQIHARCITVNYSIERDVKIWSIAQFNGWSSRFSVKKVVTHRRGLSKYSDI